MTVPPAAGVTPLKVAESETDPPTIIVVADNLVVTATPVRGLTDKGSQRLVTPLLLVSPL